MVQAHIGGNCLEPATGSWALSQVGEAVVGLEEYLLRDVFGLGVVGDQSHSRAEYHVLVVLHERLKLFWICHRPALTIRSELMRPLGGLPESRSVSCHTQNTRERDCLFQEIG